MSKGNNQRGRYNALNIRLAKYVALVQAVYDMLNQQAANIAMMTGYDGSKEFHFSDFPQVREAVQRLQQDYVQSMHAIIYRGTSDEWKQSNLVQDLLADKILGKYSSKSWGRKHEVYYQTNSDALKAFQQRKDNGMGLSQRIWNMSGNYKEELEYSISTAIQKGTSAVQLSKKLSKYLNDFPSLKKDYKEKYGKDVDCHDCEYRSIRLARSEINMAYRSAEQTRWRQMDFVLGYEIKLSKKHKKDSDICDDLAGQYPKDFVWTGWHPNDLCYVIPILKTEEEFWHDEDTPPINQTKPVTEFPSGFNEYMEGHLDKISISNQKGTLSYWLRDNEDVKGCALLMNKAKQVGNVVQDIAERIADEHGAIVTPINYKGFASLYRKVHYADQYGVRTALTEVKDSVRNTIVLDGDLNSVIKDLAKDSHWLRTKVQTADKFCGYSGNIVNLTMDNGVVAEIQVNTPKMIFAKESEKHARAILGDELYDKIAKETGMEGGLGHKLYEQIRVLDKVADAEKKASLEKQMRDYYSHFQPKEANVAKVEYQPPRLQDILSEVKSDAIISQITGGRIKTFEEFFKQSGLTIEEAQKKLEKAISDTDVYMCIDGKTLLSKVIKGDGYFKSSIETCKGSFKIIGEDRAVKERKMFGMADDCDKVEYPKYGFLASKGQMDYEDIIGFGYGDTYVRFKRSAVSGHSTFTIGDSYDGNQFIPKEVLAKEKHQLQDTIKFGFDPKQILESKQRLKEIEELEKLSTAWRKVAPASPLNAPQVQSLLSMTRAGETYKDLGAIIEKGVGQMGWYRNTYVECQIYGKLGLNDVASIEVSSIRQKEQLEKILKKKGLNIEVVPCKFNTKLKELENAFTDYDDKASQIIHSLTDKDIDNLGDFYIDGLMKRFGDKKNLWWKKIEMPNDFVSLRQKVFDGTASIEEKRTYCKMYLAEIRKKSAGAFPKVWWKSYRPTQGGWTDDVLQKDLLRRKE